MPVYKQTSTRSPGPLALSPSHNLISNRPIKSITIDSSTCKHLSTLPRHQKYIVNMSSKQNPGFSDTPLAQAHDLLGHAEADEQKVSALLKQTLNDTEGLA